MIELRDLETVLAFVASGFGISFLPALVERVRFPGVVMLPVRPRVMAGIVAVWNESRLPATGRRFLEMLRAEKVVARSD